MADTTKIVLEVDSTGAVKSVGKLSDAINDVNEDANNAGDTMSEGMQKLDEATGGAISKFKAFRGGLKNVITGMKTLKGAVAATGIGALLIAITSVVSYFKRTEKGAQTLRVITAALGSVMGNILDVVTNLGENLVRLFTSPKEALIDFGNGIKDFVLGRFELLMSGISGIGSALKNLFSGNFKQAAKDAGKAFIDINRGINPTAMIIEGVVKGAKDLGTELINDAKAAAQLERAMNKVKQQERDLVVERARSNKEIEKAKLIAVDVNKSAEERIAALQRANELELQVSDQEMKTAKERLRVMQEQAELSASSEEDLDAIAEAQARVLQLEQESIAKRASLAGAVVSLEAQIKAERQAAADAEAARIKEETDARLAALEAIRQATSTDQENEIFAAQAKYQQLLADAEKYGQDTAALEEAKEAELAAIRQKYADQEAAAEKAKQDEAKAARQKELDDETALQEAKIQLTMQAAGSAIQLFKTLSGENEKNARKAFMAEKALGIASAVINTARAITKVFAETTDPTPTQSFRIGNAIAIGLAGAAQVAAIAKQKFQTGEASGTDGIPSVSGSTGVGGATPSFNVVGNSGVNQIAESINGMNERPVKAYVVSGEVSTAQELDRKKELTTSFG